MFRTWGVSIQFHLLLPQIITFVAHERSIVAMKLVWKQGGAKKRSRPKPLAPNPSLPFESVEEASDASNLGRSEPESIDSIDPDLDRLVESLRSQGNQLAEVLRPISPLFFSIQTVNFVLVWCMIRTTCGLFGLILKEIDVWEVCWVERIRIWLVIFREINLVGTRNPLSCRPFWNTPFNFFLFLFFWCWHFLSFRFFWFKLLLSIKLEILLNLMMLLLNLAVLSTISS